MSSEPPPDRPEIEYPCRWQYKTIGASAQLMRAAIAALLADAEYTLDVSNVSRHGKYSSLSLTVTVASQAERDELFAALRSHPDIVLVL